MRSGECTRRALIVGPVLVSACATLGSHDPIIGRWRGESADLIFTRDGRVRLDPIPSEDDGSIDYIFPRISWRKNGSTYRLLYIWPRDLHEPAEERQAQIRHDELIVTAQRQVLRYRRVTYPE
jgi:hypothetical protein